MCTLDTDLYISCENKLEKELELRSIKVKVKKRRKEIKIEKIR